jgi:hypothetical protein
MYTLRTISQRVPLLALAALLAGPAAAQDAGPPFRIERGDRIVFVGNSFAERLQLFPHFEALLTALQPDDSLTFRNLSWSGDEVALQPRPLNFGDMHTHLREQGADVIFASFGFNESFAGEAGLPAFRIALDTLLQSMQAHRYNGETAPRIVLISPIAQERLERIPADAAARNRVLALYTEAMRAVAVARGVRFVDLYTPTVPLMESRSLGDLTINGIHLNDRGNEIASRLMARSLGWPAAAPTAPPTRDRALLGLAEAIREKNQLFFYRWRAVNGEYIYGRRKEPFGVVNFPPEMKRLEEMIGAREKEIWRMAKGVQS